MPRLVANAETWENVYQAFADINFGAFDYNTVKQSLLDYVKLYFPETFNDFIESSEFIAIIEVFAYIAELVAYRLDVNAQENFISTAQRKDSILRLATLISYKATRPLPARGLVKITSVSTTESVVDTNGINLANTVILWNDPSNPNWKEQFILVMNRALDQVFGSVGPTDRFQIQDVLFELYSWNLTPLPTGVFTYSATINGGSTPMELVPITNDPTLGIIERRPENNANFTLVYGQDGLGDSSNTTGFFCYTKQGQLQRFRSTFDGVTPNQTYLVNATNVNDTDVWVNNVDPVSGATLNIPQTLPYLPAEQATISGEWVQVDIASAQNVIFNTNPLRNKYEVDTGNNNQITIVFGDGEFADIPSGTFDMWVRTSLDQDIVVPQASIVNKSSSFTYVDSFGNNQTFTFTFSLTGSLQNASASETIDHIRTTAPAVYYSQDRMVNGQDYNVFMLQDSSILKLRSINRTFAGDSQYITWNDASGTYANVKIFGDDGIIYFENQNSSVTTPIISTDTLISTYIEPLLSSTDIFLQIVGAGVLPQNFSRQFTVAETASITAALTPPPTPVVIELYYNTTLSPTQNWYAVKQGNLPPGYLPGNPGTYIPIPLIVVTQTSIFQTSYNVTWTARRIVFESPTTAFWSINGVSTVIDYDTQDSNYDNIIILQANVNSDRTGILTQNWNYILLGQEIVESGPNLGLPDVNRVSILPTDTTQTGIPDNLDLTGILNPSVTVTPASLALLIPPNTVTLPISYIVPGGVLFPPGDVTITSNDSSATFAYPNYPASEDTVQNQIIVTMNTATTATITVIDYVYFSRLSVNDPWVFVSTTDVVITSYIADQLAGTNLWVRYPGRGNLNFAWFHFSPLYYLVDPSPTNIIDCFVITKGYYLALKAWLEDPLLNKPDLPTPLDLRTSYNYLLNNAMISDTVILQPGTIKLLFGSNADPSLQATFMVIRSSDTTLTDNQIKTIIVTTVRNFFDITLWEFGETFYFTELATAIHMALPTELSSVVIVPTLAQDQFGDLFQVQPGENEIFYPDITVDDIQIVTGYTATNLRI